MRKFVITGLAVVFGLLVSAGAALAAPRVVLNGQELVFDVPPVIEQGRTLVPLRAIFEALGADVNWDGRTRTVTATKGQTRVKLTIGARTAYRNGAAVPLDVPARIVNGRTLVPLRFVSEALGAKVNWDAKTQVATIWSSSSVSPIFELKELHADVVTPDNTPGKIFRFTYSTNQDSIQMKITAPDGSSTGPFTLSGPREKKGWALIPPKDRRTGHRHGYIALPGTYKMTVYDKSGTTKIWEKDFAFQGAKLLLEDARVTKWKWHWSWPVYLFYTDEIAITVSNQGDLPSHASAILTLDGALGDRQKEVYLGYVAPGETRTFTAGGPDIPFLAFVVQVNFKRVGDLIPPSIHALSVCLVSDLPKPSYTEGFPQESLQYYSSSQPPYPIVTHKVLTTEYRLLLLDDYSTTVQTPPVQTG